MGRVCEPGDGGDAGARTAAKISAIEKRRDDGRDFVAGMHIARLPAGTPQHIDARELHGEVLDALGPFGDVDLHVAMRIGPLKRQHRPLQHHGPRVIEDREGVMRPGCQRTREEQRCHCHP